VGRQISDVSLPWNRDAEDGGLVCAASERYDNWVTDELVFEVTQEADGGFCAECLTDAIVTEGDSWEELRKNVREVVRAFYFDQPETIPALIRLHLVRNEVFASA
jgi:hypothetical protein